MSLAAYLPQDRLRALARNVPLPDRTTGAALFADISGFTPLTEKLTRELGPRRGAEELTKQINAIYAALIAAVEQYGGSVIGFAGDAITCWFDDAAFFVEETHPGAGAAAPAVTTALALQAAMHNFPNLGLKVAIATGPARRFVVGDPTLQLVDTLAGATVARVANGEHLAQRGELLVDEATAQALGAALNIAEWRLAAATAERFAVVAQLAQPVVPSAWPPLPTLSATQLTNWVPQAVWDRAQTEPAALFSEFRPCVALFVRFSGIDYDAPRAGAQLDHIVRELQTSAARHEGVVLQLTIGDKGSYAYLVFGALRAHENDALRAVKTACAIRAASSVPVQIGITQGIMLVGAYGGPTRRTYGALGDEVNLAARLMQAATTGEIVVSSLVHKAIAPHYACEPRARLTLKGKAEPLSLFTVTSERQGQAFRLQEPTYALPMVGRQRELQIINTQLHLAAQGQGQVISLVAEAGMGKSRLVAEVLRAAREQGFELYGGAGQSFGTHTAYLAWRDIWYGILRLDPNAPLASQIRTLTDTLAAIDPLCVQRAPLLGLVLDLPMPDNDLTRSFDTKLRKESLEALLVNCLKAQAQRAPTCLVLEDLHWLDALSHDLLEAVGRVSVNLPVLLVLAYRPPLLARVLELPHAIEIHLPDLTPPEAEQWIALKLGQLGMPGEAALLQSLKHKIIERAQGNPFFIEETLNYLCDQAPDWANPQAIAQLEWPTSLHTLILSRIDTLTAREKLTLKVASIIGRVFSVAWLQGYYPALGAIAGIKADLEQLRRLDITPLDTPEPELAYLFKHIVTQEVTYQSLPYATRAQLHEALAQYLETLNPDAEPSARALNLLAFHYSRSENAVKQREYFRKAGEAAQKSFANATALGYYNQLLPLLPAASAQSAILLRRGAVLELIGQWAEAESDYRAVLALAGDNPAAQAEAQLALGKLYRQRGEHAVALSWLAQARANHTARHDPTGLTQVSLMLGHVLCRLGNYASARAQLNAGLALAQTAGDKVSVALALNTLGSVAYREGDYATARALYTESLSLRREVHDTLGVSAALNNLGQVARDQGDLPAALAFHEESLALKRAMGDKLGIAVSLTNLGNVAYSQHDWATARALFTEGLALQREMGAKRSIAILLNNLGLVAQAQGDPAGARALHEESLALYREIGDKWGMAYALLGLGLVALTAPRDLIAARAHILASLRLRQNTGDRLPQTSSLIGAAGLVLQEGHAQRAAQFLGTVATALQTLKVTLETEVEPWHNQTLAAARAQLGEAAFNAAWAEGEKMTLDAAVQLALQEPLPT